MPEGLAEFFVRALCPPGGVVLDPFAGGGTTTVVARRLGLAAGALEIHPEFVEARRRIAADIAEDVPCASPGYDSSVSVGDIASSR